MLDKIIKFNFLLKLICFLYYQRVNDNDKILSNPKVDFSQLHALNHCLKMIIIKLKLQFHNIC